MASLRRKIGVGLLVVTAAGIAALAYALSHETPCGPAPAVAVGATTMKAVVRRCYGPPEVLAVEEVEKPVPKDDQVLVRVHAAAINPLEWHFVRGKPYLARLDAGLGAPRNPRIGVDYAGTVEAVGKDVTKFKPGDEVFGAKWGALAEYVTVNETGAIVPKPANLTMVQAGSVNVAAITSLQALRDRGQVKPGTKVLINGASGGVGTFAVQIAKALGAEVTGVCSSRNVELVRSLGADHVIDYTKEDFAESGQLYDVVMDNVGNRALGDVRRVLKPQGKFILIGGGGPDAGPWIGPLILPIKAMVVSWFVDQELGMFVSETSREDLAVLAEMMQSGKVTPVIDRNYRATEIVEAMTYLETGRARGKVVVTFD